MRERFLTALQSRKSEPVYDALHALVDSNPAHASKQVDSIQLIHDPEDVEVLGFAPLGISHADVAQMVSVLPNHTIRSVAHVATPPRNLHTVLHGNDFALWIEQTDDAAHAVSIYTAPFGASDIGHRLSVAGELPSALLRAYATIQYHRMNSAVSKDSFVTDDPFIEAYLDHHELTGLSANTRTQRQSEQLWISSFIHLFLTLSELETADWEARARMLFLQDAPDPQTADSMVADVLRLFFYNGQQVDPVQAARSFRLLHAQFDQHLRLQFLTPVIDQILDDGLRAFFLRSIEQFDSLHAPGNPEAFSASMPESHRVMLEDFGLMAKAMRLIVSEAKVLSQAEQLLSALQRDIHGFNRVWKRLDRVDRERLRPVMMQSVYTNSL